MSGDDANGAMFYQAQMHRHGAISLAVSGESMTSPYLVVVWRRHGGIAIRRVDGGNAWPVGSREPCVETQGQLLPRGRQVFAQPVLASSVAGDHEPSYRHSSA